MVPKGYHWILLGLLLPSTAYAQRLLFQVSLPAGLEQLSCEVQIEQPEGWSGVPLRDDGSQEGDVAHDGIATGWHDGPYLRHHALRLIVDEQELYYAMEKTEIDDTLRIAWSLRDGPQGLEVSRSSALRASALPSSSAALPMVAAFGWGALALLYTFGIAALYLRTKRPPSPPERKR